MKQMEWQNSPNAFKMLSFLNNGKYKFGEYVPNSIPFVRKCRLFTFACLLAKEGLAKNLREGVEVGYDWLEGLAKEEDVIKVIRQTKEYDGGLMAPFWEDVFKVTEGGFAFKYYGRYQKMADIAREIFGDPFLPVKIPVDSDVQRMALAIYNDRSFSDMPILADALEDAGCSDEQILNHCRGGCLGLRGCFVIDEILGRGLGCGEEKVY